MFDDPEEIHVVEPGTIVYCCVPRLGIFSGEFWNINDEIIATSNEEFAGVYLGEESLFFQNKGPFQKMWSCLKHVKYTGRPMTPMEENCNPRVEIAYRDKDGILYRGWVYVGNLTLLPPRKRATSDE